MKHRQQQLMLSVALAAACFAGVAWVQLSTVSNLVAMARLQADERQAAERDITTAEQQQAQLEAHLELLSLAVQQELDGRQALVKAAAERVAGSQLLGAWLLNHEAHGLRAGVSAANQGDGSEQAVAATTWPGVDASWVAIYDRQGRQIAHRGEAGAHYDPVDAIDDGVRQALQGLSSSFVAQLPERPGVASEPYLMYAHPIRGADGRRAGAVVAGIDLAQAEPALEALLSVPSAPVLLTVSEQDLELLRLTSSEPPDDDQPSRAFTTNATLDSGLKVHLEGKAPDPARARMDPLPVDGLNRNALLALLVIALTAALLLPMIYKEDRTRLKALSQRAEQISLGQTDLPPPSLEDSDELGELARALERLRLSIQELMRRHPRRNRWG